MTAEKIISDLDIEAGAGPVMDWYAAMAARGEADPYSGFTLLPRGLLQSMPIEWQRRFVELMKALHLDNPMPRYHVRRPVNEGAEPDGSCVYMEWPEDEWADWRATNFARLLPSLLTPEGRRRSEAGGQ